MRHPIADSNIYGLSFQYHPNHGVYVVEPQTRHVNYEPPYAERCHPPLSLTTFLKWDPQPPLSQWATKAGSTWHPDRLPYLTKIIEVTKRVEISELNFLYRHPAPLHTLLSNQNALTITIPKWEPVTTGIARLVAEDSQTMLLKLTELLTTFSIDDLKALSHHPENSTAQTPNQPVSPAF